MTRSARLAPRIRTLSELRRRAGWGMADQALSSLTNFALALIAARTFSPADLGGYALVFTTYLVGLNVARPLGVEPLLIRYSGAGGQEWRAATENATGIAFVVGVVAGAIALCVGLLLGGTVGGGLIGLSLAFPGLLVQDTWRFAFIAAGRGRSAFANDGIWALALFPLLAFVEVARSVSVQHLVLLWGAAATLAALAGVRQSGVRPIPGRWRTWLSGHRDLVRPLTAQSAISLGAGQLSAYGIALVAGLSVAGALRAAQIVMGPIVFLMQALQLVAVPEARRLLNRSYRSLVVACVAYAVSVASITVAWGVIVFLVPDSFGRAIIRDNWEPAHAVVIVAAVSLALGWVGTAGTLALRVIAQARRVLLGGATTSIAGLVCAVAGASSGGAVGGALGNAVGNLIGAVVTWTQVRRAQRDPAMAVQQPDVAVIAPM